MLDIFDSILLQYPTLNIIGQYASYFLMLFSAAVVVISWIDYIENKITSKKIKDEGQPK